MNKLWGTCLSMLSATTIYAASDWGYEQTDWAKLNPSYQACNGANQSPINIQHAVKAELTPLQFSYHNMIQTIEHKGHTIQVDFSEGGILHLDGDQFVLKQFHLHSPSENQINGKSYPLEIHFVHTNAKAELAVVALMFNEGIENPMLKRIWERLPKQAGSKVTLVEPQPVRQMLPKNLEYYRFSGSLTTPPCSEGVRWLMMKEIQYASHAQIAAFTELMGHPNNRPIQPLNGRIIAEN
jgi:carbonic anhydrase